VTTVEDLGWQLDLGEGRRLEFVSTPYLHFPGAFVSYEPWSRTLLSADLFGGFNDGTRLVATSMDDFEALRRFHEHYMPSRDLLLAGLATIRVHAPHIDHVLPQHGYVLPPELVDPMFDQLAGLDCGLMALAGRDASIESLINDAATVHRFADEMAAVGDVAEAFALAASVFGELLPLDHLEVEVGDHAGARWSTALDPEGRIEWRAIETWTRYGELTLVIPLENVEEVPAAADGTVNHIGDGPADVAVTRSAAVLHLTRPAELRPHLVPMLRTVLPTVHALVAHLVRDHEVAAALDDLQHRASHDPLTGLFNREHLRRLVLARPEHLWVMLLDLDHFKRVNDELGHLAGDDVLRAAAAVLTASVRGEDRVVRYGGEEFLVLLPCSEAAVARRVAERIRSGIAEQVGTALGPVTVSIGLASFHEGELLEAAIARADAALYAAKAAGRDRVEVAEADRAGASG
jgi:diguanylate cyclase (GGDEF)-like protein